MFLYSRSVDTEITGFGEVELKHGTYYCTDTYIFPQKANGGHVELDGDALSEWMRDCSKKGLHDRVAKSRLWWHSHVNMSCFRSGTDNDTVERLLTSMPYVISCVVNKAYQYELSLHLKEPVRITFNHMNPHVDRWDTQLAELDCAKEAAKLVKDTSSKVDKIDWTKLHSDDRYEKYTPKPYIPANMRWDEATKKYIIPKADENLVEIHPWNREDLEAWRVKNGHVPPPAKPPKEIVNDPWSGYDRYSQQEQRQLEWEGGL